MTNIFTDRDCCIYAAEVNCVRGIAAIGEIVVLSLVAKTSLGVGGCDNYGILDLSAISAWCQ